MSGFTCFRFRVSGFGCRVSNFWSFRFWVSDFRSQGIRFLVPCDSGLQFQVSGAVYFSFRLFLASDFGLRELAYRDVEKVSSKFWRKQLRVAVRVIPVFPGSGFRVQGSGFRFQGSGFRVQGSGFEVRGLGFGGWGFRIGVVWGVGCGV